MRRRAGPAPGPLGPPPAALSSRKLPLVALSGPWFRVHHARRGANFFGRTGENRFDAPDGSYGVLYAAVKPEGAFIETFGEALDDMALSRRLLNRRKLSQMVAARALRFVHLDGAHLVALGADARLCSAEHSVAQQWSKALHEHPSRPDGLLYRARHDPEQLCVAIFERAAGQVRAVPAAHALGHRTNAPPLGSLLDYYGIGLGP